MWNKNDIFVPSSIYHYLIHQIHGLTITEIPEDVGISFGSRQVILIEKPNMHRVAEKFVPACWARARKQIVLTSVKNSLTVTASMKTSW